MGPRPPLRRRALLHGAAAGLAAPLLGACSGQGAGSGDTTATWAGASATRGHRLRDSAPLPEPARTRRVQVLVAGAGVAGLAAARGFLRRGVDDLAVLELEDAAGGTARGGLLGGQACPLGAHYLPLPPPEAHELREWLHELGLLRTVAGREVADERHLCHSPQERLFIDGAWHEGVLPPADPGSATHAQYRRFAARLRALAVPGAARAFALPAHRGPWGPLQADLDRHTFAHWLDAHGLRDERLRWYLDYACRDEYGAPADTVSAWAGVHYFASRHGFHAPGEDSGAHEPVFTWPEGNAWLVQRLAAPLGERLHTGRSVLRVLPQREGVEVLAFDEATQQAERWLARTVVLALPLFVAARVLQGAPPALADALRTAAALQPRAPWLVANVVLPRLPLDRPGAPLAWDNVVYGRAALGYVNARHQSLDPRPGPLVLSAYHALPLAERAALLQGDAAAWRARVLAELALAHPEVVHEAGAMTLARWGHAMPVPVPGTRRHPALAALRSAEVQRGPLRFAHADLAGYAVFEEAFTAGCEAAVG